MFNKAFNKAFNIVSAKKSSTKTRKRDTLKQLIFFNFIHNTQKNFVNFNF